MPETRRLLELARTRLRDGLLPRQASTTVALGGCSGGSVCGVCGAPIDRGAPEIELAWAGTDRRHRVLLHPACHGAWLTASRLDVAEAS